MGSAKRIYNLIGMIRLAKTVGEKLRKFSVVLTIRKQCMGHNKWLCKPLNHLLDHQNINLSTMWIIITHCSNDYLGTLVVMFWIMAIDINIPIMVMNEKAIISGNTCICM